MPSIDRSTYVTPVQRGAFPGGYDVQSTGHGTRSIIEFDNISGLQRRIGTRPYYEDLMRQGCQPTGQRSGPPGYESEEYNCPFPIVGQPAWAQPGRTRSTVFEGFGTVARRAAAPGVSTPETRKIAAGYTTQTRSASDTKATASSAKRTKAMGLVTLVSTRLAGVKTTLNGGGTPTALAVSNLKNAAAGLGKELGYLKAAEQVSAKALVLEAQTVVTGIESGALTSAQECGEGLILDESGACVADVASSSFFQRNKVNLIIGGVGVAVLGAALYFVFKD